MDIDKLLNKHMVFGILNVILNLIIHLMKKYVKFVKKLAIITHQKLQEELFMIQVYIYIKISALNKMNDIKNAMLFYF